MTYLQKYSLRGPKGVRVKKQNKITSEVNHKLTRISVYFGVASKELTFPWKGKTAIHIQCAKYMSAFYLIREENFSLRYCQQLFHIELNNTIIDEMFKKDCLRKFYDNLIYGEEKAIY